MHIFWQCSSANSHTSFSLLLPLFEITSTKNLCKEVIFCSLCCAESGGLWVKKRAFGNEKWKRILFENQCNCHWWVPIKKGREIKAAAEPLALKDSPCQEGEGQSLSEGPCPRSSFTASFLKPNNGFVHLVLWSRLQTLSLNSNCHTCLCPLYLAHVFHPLFAALSRATASGNQPVTMRALC